MMWVVAAFAAVWIAVFGYVVHLGRVQERIAEDIAALKARR